MFESFDLTKFGEHLRELRKSLGYTQEAAANVSGLAIDTLRRIEKGEVIPRYDTLIHLSLTYKKDLLAVLSSYSNANAFFYFYYTLEDAILLNDLGALEQLAQDFDDYMCKLLLLIFTPSFLLCFESWTEHILNLDKAKLEPFPNTN